MKKYDVQVDLTFSVPIEVEAESEEMAMRLAEIEATREPTYYKGRGWFVGAIAVCSDEVV